MELNLDERELVVEECKGCSKVTEEGVCEAFLSPKVKWARGKKCPLTTVGRVVVKEEVGKKRVGQQKHGKKRR